MYVHGLIPDVLFSSLKIENVSPQPELQQELHLPVH